ncbi:hypothetical protein JTB14_037096 [Gonioctena quinquepunctata]|nr:hypothetical protein JTB14_037096 [Gonioctena quinquepunctata]
MELRNIKFEGEVEKHPDLYDYNLREYSKKYCTEKAWNGMAKKATCQREEHKILKRHLFLAKQDHNECFIEGNKLFVNGVAHNSEELTESENSSTTPDSPKSALSAPNTYQAEKPTGDTQRNKKYCGESIRSIPKAITIK